MQSDASTANFFSRAALRVVLVAPRNPLNIGAAARAMANFGCVRLRVVNPYEVAFREARSAVKAAPLLASAEEFTTVAAAVADCALVVGTTSVGHRELQHPLRRLESGARLMRIPTVALDRSITLGQAVSVCVYELARDSRAAAARPQKPKPALAADTEQITAMLAEALERSGYIKPLTASSAKTKVRRLVRRLNLSARDAPVVLGMLRQILWKLGGT